ncbi:MAG: GNAT family N-acetyltransferase [Proteocatella sp.]
MISDYREIENSYIQNFSKKEDCGDYLRFYDDKLPGMYAFNFILIKESMESGNIHGFVCNILEQAKASSKEFLKILLHPQISIDEHLKSKFIEGGFELKTNIYMKLNNEKLDGFKLNGDCTVKIASKETEFKDVAVLDIKTCVESGIPEAFANEKSARKGGVYKSSDRNLKAYVSYLGDVPVGKCELYLDHGYAKIEDFDVIEKYQRRGIGTAMLKTMITDARGRKAENIYLIADKDDTPKEMYLKLGFEIIAEEYELWLSLQ